ncbi:MAG: hypothetical protein P4N60_06475 [Verrucomicrobiae bacterium]|nr:hypothetical protein [Verrucomicrobiae bacterium]
MKPLAVIVLLLVVSLAYAEDKWKTVDEGFRVTMPASWQKQKVQPFDSNCGTYKAKTADLEFDEVFGLGYTAENSQSLIDELKKKETNPKLLRAGEEVWHINGRIARFVAGKLDPKVYGKRRFSNVAELYVPYASEPGYLSIYIIYKSDEDLPTVRRVLQSIEWKKKSPAAQEKKTR